MLPLGIPRDAIGQDIMSGLDIERLLDFGIRRAEEMDENDRRDEKREDRICLARSA